QQQKEDIYIILHFENGQPKRWRVTVRRLKTFCLRVKREVVREGCVSAWSYSSHLGKRDLLSFFEVKHLEKDVTREKGSRSQLLCHVHEG
ncbi:hypothetical protein VIGAN_06091900, partial [Vigna angularis var. angularis]